MPGPVQSIAFLRHAAGTRGSCCCQRGTATWAVPISSRSGIAYRMISAPTLSLHLLPRLFAKPAAPSSLCVMQDMAVCTASVGLCNLTCQQPSLRARPLSHCCRSSRSRDSRLCNEPLVQSPMRLSDLVNPKVAHHTPSIASLSLARDQTSAC